VLSASFDASRQLTPSQTLQTNAASGADTYSLHTPQVSVSFVPDVFGGTRRAVESAQAQADVAAFQREAVYTTLASNIALAAIQEASLRGQIAATRRLIEIQTQLLDILRRQNDRGQIALPDVVAQEPRWRRRACCCRHWKTTRPATQFARNTDGSVCGQWSAGSV
jgi:outer membrane protein TolC